MEAIDKVTDEELQVAIESWKKAELLEEVRDRNHPILPQAGKKNILITAALPYVNNIPHLGNLIGCVLSADVFSRYCRTRNWNSLYICGTDEYGTATETKAAEEGLTPQEICDKYNSLHREVYEWFNIDFDHFGRTTAKQHTEIVQDVFWKLYHNGYILPQTVEQLYCSLCDRFLADRFVEGICPLCNYEDARGDQCDCCGKLISAVDLKNPKCKICDSSPSVKESKHLFLDLPKLEPLIRDHLKEAFENPGFSTTARAIAKSYLKDGIKPGSITRDLKWGNPVPLEGYTDKVFYVWFGAPIGYISITAAYTEHWEKWWKKAENVVMYDFIGKDNVPFHSVVYPSSLLGTRDGYTVVSNLNATEYLNYEDGKFSKSRGVGLFGNQAKETGIAPDVWRFYLLYVRPESQDSVFSWNDFMLKNNSELVDNLGNFISSSLKFALDSFGGVVPEAVLMQKDVGFIVKVNREIRRYIADMESVKLRDGLKKILNISRLGNEYFRENAVEELITDSEDGKERARTEIAIGVNLSCIVSILLDPYMPNTARSISKQLNALTLSNRVVHSFVRLLPSGHRLGKPALLFRNLENSEIEFWKSRFGGRQSE